MTKTIFGLLVTMLIIFHASLGSPEIEPIEPSKEVGETGAAAAAGVVVGDDVKKGDVVESDDTKLEKVSVAYFGASGSFVHGFVATLSVILVSELGDKTFFIGEFRNVPIQLLRKLLEVYIQPPFNHNLTLYCYSIPCCVRNLI